MKNALVLILVLTSVSAKGQKLVLNDLFTVCTKPTWVEVNELLLNRGWEYHESSKGDNDHYSTITWSFNKSGYDDKAQGWFYLYAFDNSPSKIRYSTFNLSSFNLIKKAISSAGMRLVDTSIDDDQIVTKYANQKFYLSIITEKVKQEDFGNESSLAAYHISVIKKSSVYDPDNGLKKVYDREGNVKEEYYVKDGLFEGVFNSFYPNGNIKITRHYLNDKKHGQSKEYDEDGNLTAEFYYAAGELNGPYKLYSEGKVSLEGNLERGEKDGFFKEFNEEGDVSSDYWCKAGALDGLYNVYFYNERRLIGKVTGFYKNGQQDGLWQTLKINSTAPKVISFTNYKAGRKEGAFKQLKGDSVIFGSYVDEMLSGPYKVYKNIGTMLTKIKNGDTINNPIIEKGWYSKGKKNGAWKFYSLTETLIEEGEYLDDKKWGEWRYYFENVRDENGNLVHYSGKLYLVENYASGMLNGKSIRYAFLDNVIVPCDAALNESLSSIDTCYQAVYRKILDEAFYKDDELHGPFQRKDSAGVILFKGNFIHGEKDALWIEGTMEYDADGNKYYQFYKGNYEKGLRNGVWEEYFDDKQVHAKYLFVDGKLNGKSVKYDQHGRVFEELFFENGKLAKLNEYDSMRKTVENTFDILEESDKHFIVRHTKKDKTKKVCLTRRIIRNDDAPLNPNFLKLVFFVEGYNDGEFSIYDSEDKLIEYGNLIQDVKIGTWKRYYYDLNIYIEKDYLEGESIIDKFYVINSSMQFSGKFVERYDNGKVKSECKIVNGLKDGKCKVYNENGEVIKVEKYKFGILKG